MIPFYHCRKEFQFNRIEYIDRRWIVTAAHCVEEEMDKYIASFGIDRNGMYEMHVEIERSNIYIFPERRSIFSDDRDDIG